MKKGLVPIFICAYLLLSPSAKVMSPSTSDHINEISHFTPVSSTIVDNVTDETSNPPQ